MKVFVSWSGTKSKKVAEVLRAWIHQVIQSAETWISSDIEKGGRWNDEIRKKLEECKFGIICLDKSNLHSEWILFEAGALAKTNDGYVWTFLVDIKPTDVTLPLGNFQHTSFNKEDIRKLVQTINRKAEEMKENSLAEKDLEDIFETHWPRLHKNITTIKKQGSVKKEIKRTDRDIMEEVLEQIRSLKITGSQPPMVNAIATNDWDSIFNEAENTPQLIICVNCSGTYWARKKDALNLDWAGTVYEAICPHCGYPNKIDF